VLRDVFIHTGSVAESLLMRYAIYSSIEIMVILYLLVQCFVPIFSACSPRKFVASGPWVRSVDTTTPVNRHGVGPTSVYGELFFIKYYGKNGYF